MSAPALRKSLAIGADLALILVTLFFGGITFQRWRADRSVQSLGPPRPGLSLRAMKLPWARRKTTVVLLLQRGCAFCAQSVPAYSALMSTPSRLLKNACSRQNRRRKLLILYRRRWGKLSFSAAC